MCGLHDSLGLLATLSLSVSSAWSDTPGCHRAHTEVLAAVPTGTAVKSMVEVDILPFLVS